MTEIKVKVISLERFAHISDGNRYILEPLESELTLGRYGVIAVDGSLTQHIHELHIHHLSYQPLSSLMDMGYNPELDLTASEIQENKSVTLIKFNLVRTHEYNG